MTEQNFGTVTALEFRVSPEQGFEDIVEEFDISFRPLGLTRRSLIWDGEDIAIIERDSIRIVLGWLPPEHPDDHVFLVLAIGHAPNSRGVTLDDSTNSMLSSLLINHAKSYLPIGAVLHAKATRPVGTELIDTMCDVIRRDYQQAATTVHEDVSHPIWTFETAPEQEGSDMGFAELDQATQERTQSSTADILDADYVDLDSVEVLSLPKKLTIYTLGATMLLYTPPVGATLLVYTTLRDFMPDQPRRLERPAA